MAAWRQTDLPTASSSVMEFRIGPGRERRVYCRRIGDISHFGKYYNDDVERSVANDNNYIGCDGGLIDKTHRRGNDRTSSK